MNVLIKSNQINSDPSVVLLRSMDSLVLPKVFNVQSFALWVSSSKSLGNPGVVESLSVSELLEAECCSNGGTSHCSVETLVQVNVEVVWLASSGSEKVRQAQSSTDDGESNSFGTSRDFVVVIKVKEVNEEELWVVLDEFDVSYSLAEGCVFLLNVVRVALDVWAVSSHF